MNCTILYRNIILCLLFLLNFGCDEERFLMEVPLDFNSPENTYQTSSDFEKALTDLYARVRDIHYSDDILSYVHFLGTDIAFHSRGTSDRLGDYNVWLTPTKDMIEFHWNRWYKIIGNANTIISRLDDSLLSDEEKKMVDAEAKLFRGLAYRYLVYLYGGVPLITEEVTGPNTAFIRASKEEVIAQMISDFTDAGNNLPSIGNAIDGRVSNVVAYHYLAESYISLNEFDQAIDVATIVISDPNTALMDTRFGSRSSEDPKDDFLKFTQSGDVYWDLFQPNNQNRSSGNREAMWVIQVEPDIIGGYLSSSARQGNVLERYVVPATWSLTDPDGKAGMTGEALSDYNIGGRGVSIIQPTEYFISDIWQSDFDNDIRNAPHNIVRDAIYNNPESNYYNSSAVEYQSTNWLNQNWRWYPYPTKVTTPGAHPDQIYEDRENLILKTSAGSTYRDMYLLRLPETYLLRAEAYLKKGDMVSAADDINVVRNRANANPVSTNDINLDYILDERARELIFEEQRRITLCRTGTLVERVKKYNELNSDDIRDFHNLWPIPYAEIEANKDAVLEQNPGYN